jgi:hypothetical protein
MPTGDPHPFQSQTYQQCCDRWDIDPDRIMQAFLRPLESLAQSVRCSCENPRFDVVTLGSQRHSQFCCACGRPGSDDIESKAC